MTNETRFLPLGGRVLLATIFLLSGIAKLSAAEGTIGYIAASGLPLPELAFIGAVAAEIGGGILLIVGYQTRLVALGLALFSLVTAFVFHGASGDQNQEIHFLKNLAIAGGLLQVVAFGAGSLSLDALLRNRRTSPAGRVAQGA
ncbi:DoxX family protein [Zavarzinia compransoris]|uniref:DoxX family protein n=1 Tax=Zavarzinia marina TaxID=2911065 RepID=UPI001F3D42A3|nr:DoxX family protein [Zavarzinia marina]MCF4164748.1 DoxX family protein [Zavarzinia marina]